MSPVLDSIVKLDLTDAYLCQRNLVTFYDFLESVMFIFSVYVKYVEDRWCFVFYLIDDRVNVLFLELRTFITLSVCPFAARLKFSYKFSIAVRTTNNKIVVIKLVSIFVWNLYHS